MNRIFCYSPQPVDYVLSDQMQIIQGARGVGYSARVVATLRGKFDSDTLGKPDDTDYTTKYGLVKQNGRWTVPMENYRAFVKEVVAPFTQKTNKLKNERLSAIKNVVENYGNIWNTVDRFYEDMSEFADVVIQMTNHFVDAIDAFIDRARVTGQDEGKPLSRTQVINGVFMTNTKGQRMLAKDFGSLMQDVYLAFLSKYNRLMNDSFILQKTRERYQRNYAKVFTPEVWGAAVMLTKAKLKEVEGLNINLYDNVAEDIDISSFNENVLADLFSPEESTKEGYQIITECLSPYATLTKEIRKALSHTPLRIITYDEDGNEEVTIPKDSLGFDKTLNAKEAYGEIRECIRNSNSRVQMMNFLSNSRTLRNLYLELLNDNTLQTQIFNNFHKVFQTYLQIEQKSSDSKVLTTTLNKTSGEILFNRYMSEIQFGHGKDGIFFRNRNEWKEDTARQLVDALAPFNKWMPNSHELSFYDEKGNFLYNKANEALLKVFRAFGLDTVIKDLHQVVFKIVGSKSMFDKVFRIFDYYRDSGGFADLFDPVTDQLRSRGSFSKILLQAEVENGKIVQSQQYGRMKQLFDIIGPIELGKQYENKCRTVNEKGSNVTLYGDVMSNYMGELVKRFKQFTDIDNPPFPTDTIIYDNKTTAYNKRDVKEKREYCQRQAMEFLVDNFLNSIQFRDVSKDKFNPILKRKAPTAEGIYNPWIRELWNDAATGKMFDQDSFTQSFQYDRVVTGKFNGQVLAFENFTTQMHIKQLISSYFLYDTRANAAKGHQEGSDWRNVPVFILGDAGVCKTLKVKVVGGFDAYGFDQSTKKWYYNDDAILEEMYNIYKSELRRMELFANMVRDEDWKHNPESKNKNIIRNKSRFTLLTFLNNTPGFAGKSLAYLREEVSKADVKKAIGAYLESRYNAFIKVMQDSDMLPRGTEDEIVAYSMEERRKGTYSKKGDELLNGEEGLLLERFNEKGTLVSKSPGTLLRLKEMYYNIYLANLCQFQMFTGDLGYYSSVKDFQKRFKEVHAPGETLDIDAIDVWSLKKEKVSKTGMQRTVFAKDIEFNAEHLHPDFVKVLLRNFALDAEKMEEAIKDGIHLPLEDASQEKARQDKIKKLLGENYAVYKKYLNNTRTDGQSYRTLESYRKVLIMGGKWNDMLEAFYREYKDIERKARQENRELTEEEVERLLAFQVTLQPIKPYTFTMEKYVIYDKKLNGKTGEWEDQYELNGRKKVKSVLQIPVQIKCAEAIIIPLLHEKGSKLREMGEWMEENDVDLMAFDSCVKVGAFGQSDIEAADASGNVDVRGNLSQAMIHELSYADYKIQTNVPQHINAERAIGTQVRKLIMNNIDMVGNKLYEYIVNSNGEFIKEFMLHGGKNGMRDLNGRGIVNLYNAINSANMIQSYEAFRKVVESPSELAKLLSSSIVNSDRIPLRRLLDFALKKDAAGNITGLNAPLYEGNLAHDTFSMISAVFRKRVNKQDMSGGSLVQVSDWGINTKLVAGAKGKRPLRFVTSEGGKNIDHAEIEIPFNFFYTNKYGEKVDLEYSDYCHADGEFKKDAKGKLLIDKDFPGMRDIIAYRIPSERAYSMLNCKVVRCVPPCEGGIIRVPAEGPTIAGFDFDIDKLYILRKELREKGTDGKDSYSEYSKSELNRIFMRIYEDNAESMRDEKEGMTLEIRDLKVDIAEIRKELRLLIPNNPRNGLGIEEYQKLLADKKQQLNDELEAKLAELSHLEAMSNRTSIVSILSDIRERSGEFTRQGNKIFYEHTLNHYWNQMLEENPYMRDDDAYNKDVLFKKKAKELGLWKEPLEKDAGSQEIEFETYDFNKSVASNSRLARNNVMFDIIRGRLSDRETLKERLTPGGFEHSRQSKDILRVLTNDKDILESASTGRFSISKLLEKVKEVKEREANGETFYDDNLDACDVNTLLYYNQLNQVAGKIIGIAANQNNNQQFASLMKGLETAEPILFGQLLTAKIKRNSHNSTDSSGRSNNRIGTSLLIKEVELADGTIVDVDLTLAEFLAASKNAVKDPVLNYLNFNSLTAAPGMLLARMGYNTTDIGLLFNQPIIKDICELMANSGNRKSFDTVKNEVLKMYKSRLYEKRPNTMYKNMDTGIASEDLALNIAKRRNLDLQNTEKAEAGDFSGSWTELLNDQAFVDSQLRVLNLFEKVRNASSELNDFIKSTKYTAANAVGTSWGFFKAQEQTALAYLSRDPETSALKVYLYDTIHNQRANRALNPNTNPKVFAVGEGRADIDLYIRENENNPFAFEQCMYDINKQYIRALDKWYPYNNRMYTGVRDILGDFVNGDKGLNAEEIDALNTEMLSWVLSKHVPEAGMGSLFDPEALCKFDTNQGETVLNNREYFLYKFPMEMASYIRDYDEFSKSPLGQFVYVYNRQVLRDGKVVNIPALGFHPYVYEQNKNAGIDFWGDIIMKGRKISLYNYKKELEDISKEIDSTIN